MVSLQDVVNIALIVGIAVSVAVNIVQYLYGPWAKRREWRREITDSLAREVRDAKLAARSSGMSGGHFPTWEGNRHRLPKGLRQEVQAFLDLVGSHWRAYKDAEKVVMLTIYGALANRPTLPKVPNPANEKDPWFVKGSSGSRTSRDSLEQAMITVLTEPLLRGETVTWSWLTDREQEFVKQLKEVTDETSIGALLEEVEKRLEFHAEDLDRPRQIRARIRDFRFRHLPAANEVF